MRSALLRRKTRDRCDRSNDSSVAAFCEKKRKVSITIRLSRYLTGGAEERGRSSKKGSLGPPAIRRGEVAMSRTARSGGISGMVHRTTVRRADLIGAIDNSLVRARDRIYEQIRAGHAASDNTGCDPKAEPGQAVPDVVDLPESHPTAS